MKKQIEFNSSESATHNQKKMHIYSSETSNVSAGKISLVLDDKSGITTLSGANKFEISSQMHVKGENGVG